MNKDGIILSDVKSYFQKGFLFYENEKETKMVSRASEKEAFLLPFDPLAAFYSGLFHFIEKHCFRRDQFRFEADERGRGAPYHFQTG